MSETAIDFGATGGFGAFTGWELVNDAPNAQHDRVSVAGSEGDEVAHKLYNGRTEYTSTYNCKADTNTVPAKLGGLFNSRILTNIVITTSNSAGATMVLTGHNHDDAAHADTLKTVEHGITCPKFFGAVDFLDGEGAEGSDLVSGTITISCQHNDRLDANGNHLVGESFGASMTASTTWTGPVTTKADTPWDVTATETPNANTDFTGTTVSGTQGLTMVDASA